MMIVDAINNAGSEHAVWFLVTAYLESLQHFPASSGVPFGVVALPVRGLADLRDRIAALRSARATPLQPATPPAEVSAVLETALERLDAHLACENR